MLKSRGEQADWRSTKKVPFRQEQILPTKARRPGETSQAQMLQEKRVRLASTVEGLVIQKKSAGSIQMLYVSIVKRRVMLRESARARPNQGRVSFNR